jgi:hypothetical protein
VDAGVPVPVPSAPEIPALLDHLDVLDTGLAQPCGGEQSAEAAADDRDLDPVVERFTGEVGVGVGVVVVVAELAGGAPVLGAAVRADAPVPFGPVLGAQRLRVEAEVGVGGVTDMLVLSVVEGCDAARRSRTPVSVR